MFSSKCKASCFCMGLSTFRKFMGGGGGGFVDSALLLLRIRLVYNFIDLIKDKNYKFTSNMKSYTVCSVGIACSILPTTLGIG